MASLTRALSRLRWWFLKQEVVGKDFRGNTYYRKLDRGIDGETIERRFVQPTGGWNDYDPTAVPPEWSQWLHKTRAEPPTAEDVSRGVESRADIKRKAEEAESKEAVQRLQEQAMDKSAREASAFVQQLTGKDGGG